MTVYTASDRKMARFAPMRAASCPNTKANGTPTNWTSTTAAIRSPCSRPISVPKVVAIRMMVPMPSL